MTMTPGPSGLWRLGSLGVALALTAGCAQEAPPPPAPPEVGVSQPITRPVTLFTEFTGNTVGSEQVQIRARVTGAVERVAFEGGRPVKTGDLLFVIEPRPYKAALNAAEAALRAAEADLARAESDLRRVTQAAKTNAVSESDVDLARANRDMADASVLTAEADLDQARLQFSYTNVVSPIDGIVDRNLFDVGNVVGGPGEDVLTSVIKVAPLFVYFSVPERAILEMLRTVNYTRTEEGVQFDVPPSMRPGGHSATEEGAGDDALRSGPSVEIQVGTPADEGFPHIGELDFLSNTVDSATGTIEVRGRLPNAEGLLLPGLFVRVRIPVGTVEDAILIDERSLGTDLGGRYVYVVGADNIVEQRYVELGPTEEDGMVPVTAGLELSDSYIVDGVLRARPGMPVNPQRGGTEQGGAAN